MNKGYFQWRAGRFIRKQRQNGVGLVLTAEKQFPVGSGIKITLLLSRTYGSGLQDGTRSPPDVSLQLQLLKSALTQKIPYSAPSVSA